MSAKGVPIADVTICQMERSYHNHPKMRKQMIAGLPADDRVSVVIPCYNGAKYIEDALQSVFAQTVLPREIILVDDASTDETTSQVRKLSVTSPVPLRLIMLSTNSGGPAHPLNVGVKAAETEFIAILDQDDSFMRTKLEDQLKAFSIEPSLVVTFGKCAAIAPFGMDHNPALLRDLARLPGRHDNFQLLRGNWLRYLLMKHGNFITGYPGFMLRRDSWLRLGGAVETLKIASDYDLLLRLCGLGDCAFYEKAHYSRRHHDANICKDTLAMSSEMCEVQRRHYRSLFDTDTNYFQPTDVQFTLLQIAYGNRRMGYFRNALAMYLDAAHYGGWTWSVIRGLGSVVKAGALTWLRRIWSWVVYQ